MRARLVLAAVVVALTAGSARAEGVAEGRGMRLEWAGAELLPLSVNAGSPPSWSPPPVARYLLRELGHWSVGFVVRGEVPLRVPHGEWIATNEGLGALVLAGVDVACGQ